MSVGFTDREGLRPETVPDRLRPVELLLTRVAATDKAIHVRDAAGATAWLPRKHLTKVEEGMFDQLRLTLPTWLAIEKGLRVPIDGRQPSLF